MGGPPPQTSTTGRPASAWGGPAMPMMPFYGQFAPHQMPPMYPNPAYFGGVMGVSGAAPHTGPPSGHPMAMPPGMGYAWHPSASPAMMGSSGILRPEAPQLQQLPPDAASADAEDPRDDSGSVKEDEDKSWSDPDSGEWDAPPKKKKRVRKKQNHKCPYCDRTFSCSSNMHRHTRVHTGDRP